MEFGAVILFCLWYDYVLLYGSSQSDFVECKESVFSPISYHVISAYLLTFTPFSQRYNCVMT